MGIKHSVAKASGEVGKATEWNDDHVIDGDVQFNQYEALRFVFNSLAAPPAGPVAGQAYFDTTLNTLRVWDGTNWQNLKGGVKYWSAPGTAFYAEKVSRQAFDHIFDSAYGVAVDNLTDEAALCPVMLPDGAIIQELRVNGTAQAREVRLLRNNLIAGGYTEICAGSRNTDITATAGQTVDNSQYVYWIFAECLQTQQIYAARIKYLL